LRLQRPTARALRKTVQKMLDDEPGYSSAAGKPDKKHPERTRHPSVRYTRLHELLKKSAFSEINKSRPLRVAVNAAINALNNKGHDPSNGAYWWDGLDLKLRHSSNARIQQGFKYGAPEHNIFNMEPITKVAILGWEVTHKKTGNTIASEELGRWDTVWISTAAYGKTIFWRLNPDYVKSTHAKEYK
jgi:hypothetical protein